MRRANHGRRYGVTELVELISAAEQRCNALANTPAKPTFFSCTATKYLRPAALLKRIADRKAPPLPISGAELLQTALLGTKRRLALHAECVLVRNNIRTFYRTGDRSYALKLFTRTVGAAEAFATETATREFLSSIPQLGFRTPRVIAAEADHVPPYILEEYVAGRPAEFKRDSDTLLSLVDSFFRVYDAAGISYSPLGHVLSSSKLDAILGHLQDRENRLPQSIVTVAASDITRFLERHRELLLPVSFAHGDLALGNVLITTGLPVIIDWELAKSSTPIVFGLWRMLRKLPDDMQWFRAEYLRRIAAAMQPRSLSAPGAVLTARRQAAVYELLRFSISAGGLRKGKKSRETVRRAALDALTRAAQLDADAFPGLCDVLKG